MAQEKITPGTEGCKNKFYGNDFIWGSGNIHMYAKSEKGFSLVELIVVIAIMAVLVGVLAPAYLKYVEKSRKSGDISAMDQVIGAALAVATDEELHVPLGAEFHIDAAGGTVYFSIPVWSASADGAVRTDEYWERTENEWLETSNKGNPYTLRSKEWSKMEGQMKGIIDSNNRLVWSVTDSEGVFQEMVEYSSDFASNFASSEPDEEEE